MDEQVAINGWVFNFKNMIASRFSGYGILKHNIYVENGRVYKRKDDREFFDPPEDIYNEHIAEACASYHLEKSLFDTTSD
jgi:hypothetical protein